MRSEARPLLPIWVVLLAGCASSAAPEPASPQTDTAPRTESSPAREDTEEVDDEAQQKKGIFLSVLPVTVRDPAKRLVTSAGSDEEFARGLRVRVDVLSGYRTLGELTRRTSARVVNGVYRLTDLSQLHGEDAPTAGQKRSSFVIDFDEPSIAEPVEELRAASTAPESTPKTVSPEQIQAFVSAYIEHKTYARGFDIASRVAATRSGDCTEHAVLTTALLRYFGYPARLLFGVALVGVHTPEREASIVAAGHAWVEVYHEGGWHIVDAALHVPKSPRNQTGEARSEAVGVPGLPPGARLRLAYLPINVMNDEGPGYSRALMDEVGVDGIVGIEVDAVSP